MSIQSEHHNISLLAAAMVGASKPSWTIPGAPGTVTTRVGTDLQSISDVAESLASPHWSTYLSRIYTIREAVSARVSESARFEPRVAELLAGRFAAKEAILKVLRPQADQPIAPWTDIEIHATRDGWVQPRLRGEAAARAARAGLFGWSCAISHTDGLAIATVVALEPTTQGDLDDRR